MGLDKFIISGLLLGLVAFALFSFAYQISIDNNSTTLMNHPYMNQTFYSINNSLKEVQSKSESQYNATSNEPISAGYGSLILFSIRGAGNVFGGMITSVFNPIFNLSKNVLGIPTIILGVFISIILVLLIFLAWKMYRIGG